jgi:hypothetical protein
VVRDLSYDQKPAIAAWMSQIGAGYGLRAGYDGRTGAGSAARGFSWSALLADLASA